MRLLLDAMYSPAIGRGLRALGHDVVASQDDEELRILDDPALFAHARMERRTLVTENVKDFVPLVQLSTAAGESHFGLVLTTNASFPRHDDRSVGDLIRALELLLAQYPEEAPEGLVHWLRPAAP